MAYNVPLLGNVADNVKVNLKNKYELPAYFPLKTKRQ
jgi:hypothetical protein